MKDTTRAWLVATAILFGSAECSDSEAAPPIPQYSQYPYVYQPNRGIDEYLLWQNYIIQQQMLQEQRRFNQQYEQDRRNALAHDRVRMLQDAFR